MCPLSAMIVVRLSIFEFLSSDLIADGFFFFFKQKTAYEMRISDWSSDVCSSDLNRVAGRASDAQRLHRAGLDGLGCARYGGHADINRPAHHEIGRASCRERVCQYV